MRLYQMADPVRYPRMTTAELRDTFLLEGMFQPGQIDLAYVDLDRTVIGSAVPSSARDQPDYSCAMPGAQSELPLWKHQPGQQRRQLQLQRAVGHGEQAHIARPAIPGHLYVFKIAGLQLALHG